MSSESPYGNRISLISKSHIRYVGTLKDVNEVEQTIALEQVRSMGTEGRKGNPQEEIPPSNDIYEYIQFRATDVISVQFESEPQPPPPPAVPADPAILNAGAPIQQQQPPPPPQPQPQHQQYPAQPVQVPAAEATPVAPTIPAQQIAQAPAVAVTPSKIPTKPTAASAAAVVQYEQKLTQPEAATESHPTIVPSPSTTNEAQPAQQKALEEGEIPSSEYRSQQRRRGSNYRRGGSNYRRGNYRGGNRLNVPDSDFDFESSNSKFNKDELIKEFASMGISTDEVKVGTVEIKESMVVIPKAETYYDKSKSFFDDISCEAKERAQGQGTSIDPRTRAQKERRQNFETFGQTSVHRGRGRGRGRGRSHYSGGGGGNGSSGGGNRYQSNRNGSGRYNSGSGYQQGRRNTSNQHNGAGPWDMPELTSQAI